MRKRKEDQDAQMQFALQVTSQKTSLDTRASYRNNLVLVPFRKPPDCHHSARTVHACHAGPCTPCKQICGKTRPCGHVCEAPCHTSVGPRVHLCLNIYAEEASVSCRTGTGENCRSYAAKGRTVGAGVEAAYGIERASLPSLSSNFIFNKYSKTVSAAYIFLGSRSRDLPWRTRNG